MPNCILCGKPGKAFAGGQPVCGRSHAHIKPPPMDRGELKNIIHRLEVARTALPASSALDADDYDAAIVHLYCIVNAMKELPRGD